MKQAHHNPEQISDKLQRAKKMMAEGVTVEEACRALKIGLSTLYRWRNRYGDMNWQQARQLYEYEAENRRLKSQPVKNSAAAKLHAHGGNGGFQFWLSGPDGL